MIVMMLVIVFVVVMFTTLLVARFLIGSGRRFRHRPLDNLIQLTPIQPNPPAFWTKVDLDTLTLRDIQWNNANRTVHNFSSIKVDFSVKKFDFQGRMRNLKRVSSPAITIKSMGLLN